MCLLIGILSGVTVPAEAASAGDISARGWKHFPGFDIDPIRIIDTGRYTYFLVAQKPYATNRPTFSDPYLTLLRYDSVPPAEGIRPLADFAALNGHNVRWAEYSPEGRFLAVVYADGGIDFVGDDGKVVHNGSLKGRLIPGWDRTSSLTVCGTEAWVATDAGFIAVEGITGLPVADVMTGWRVEQVARSGSRVLLMAGGALMETEMTRCRSVADFQSLPLPDIQGTPLILLPMGHEAFGMLTETATKGIQAFCVVSHADGKWKNKAIRTFGIPRVGVPGQGGEYSMISHTLERNCIRNRDGYLIFVWTDLCQFDITGGPEAESLFRSIAVSPTITIAGSWDLTSGWTYRDRGCFVRGTASWNRIDFGNSEEVMRPKVPAVGHAGGIAYVPGLGLAAVNYGFSTYWMMNNRTAPALVSLYDGKDWSLPNGAYVQPASAGDDSNLATLYTTWRSRYPVPDPMGITADPVYPGYAWLGSTYGGIATMNLTDPSADALHFGSPADPLAGFPGFKAIHPKYSWADFSAFSTPTFDADGTLWSVHLNFDGPESGQSGVRLYYYTAANRKRMMETGDVSSAPDWPWIDLPYMEQMSATGLQSLALRHPSNRNKVVVFLRRTPYVVGILDHRGTLPDMSDDEYREIRRIRDQHGAVWAAPDVMCMAEDPLDGTVWFGTLLGLVGMTPGGETSMYIQPGKVLDIVDGDEIANPLAHVTVTGICFDPSGRMWVCAENSGVWCVSADRKRIEAHYTASNSPLPSDMAYAVGYDEARNEVMVSTSAGITVFNPQGGSYVSPGRGITFFPREITPGYAGNLVIRGLDAGSRVSIRRANEEVCRTLTADSDGNAIWDITDDTGRPVKAGIYRLEGRGCRLEIPVDR